MTIRSVRRFAAASLASALLVGATAPMTGCLAAAAGAGVGGWYAFGEDTMYSEHDLDSTVAAVKGAFEDYGVTYTGTEKQEDGVLVTGHKVVGGDTEKVQVGVWRKGEETTKIETRIGTFSQETAQLELMGKIQKRLDAMATASAN